MNYRVIFNIVGKVLCVEAVFMLPAFFIALYCGEKAAALSFVVAMMLLILVGLPPALRKPRCRDFFARDGLAAVGFTWIAVSVLGAVPFFFSGAIPNFIDCIFETVSGFTTTGASILRDVEVLPRSILYWRSFTHWLGGMGVLVFLLIFNPMTGKDTGEGMHLLRAESPGIVISKLVPRMKDSAGILYLIYIGLTLLQMVMLLCGGMPLFDTVTLTFGTAGTGGFGVLNDSVASYSPYCQWVIAVFLLLFSINFNIYFLLLLRKVRKALCNEELRVFLLIAFVAVAIIAVNTFDRYATVEETLRHSLFQVASIMSTGGFSTVDFDAWPQFSRTILVLLMFGGACTGSTGGGAKIARIVVMVKAARRAVYRAIHPNAVYLIHMDGEVVDDETVNSVGAYMLVYFLILAAATLLVTLDGFSFESNFTAAVSCMNNVGPGLGAVSPTMNYADFSWFSKLVLTFAMLIGRLEIYPVLMLFVPSVWRKISC